MGSERRGPTHYEVLGIPPQASAAEVRAAYRAAARSVHPDAGGSPVAMQAVNAAWRVLGDPGRRAAYDATLRAAGAGTPAYEAPPHAGDPPDRSGEWADVYDDLLDTSPIGPIRAVEGWWALAPPGALMLGIGLGVGGLLFVSPALFVFAGAALFIALGLFILAPLRAMTRPSGRDDRR